MSASGRLLVFAVVGLLAACAASQPLDSIPDREEAPGYRTHVALDNWYEVHAEITSGAFAGREVDLGHISRRFPGDRRLWVDTEEFEVVR